MNELYASDYLFQHEHFSLPLPSEYRREHMTTPAIQFEEKVQALAKALYDKDGLTAKEDLAKVIKKDTTLLDYIISKVAYSALLEVQRKLRHDIIKQSWKAKTFSDSEQQRVQLATSRYLDWPMMDGTKLRDATKVVVLKDANRYQNNGAGNLRNARFLQLVATRLTDDKAKVSDKFTDEELGKLLDAAKKSVMHLQG